jgi:hypothetical protein
MSSPSRVLFFVLFCLTGVAAPVAKAMSKLLFDQLRRRGRRRVGGRRIFTRRICDDSDSDNSDNERCEEEDLENHRQTMLLSPYLSSSRWQTLNRLRLRSPAMLLRHETDPSVECAIDVSSALSNKPRV